ncbi:hypothetical protein [Spirosoma panaciterrae]|uniref:hypothetical protein n=1 Tax=Spirosoma panaciterrae TaxID=496058 RepID=UPI00035E7137|nr:hypothetical protein [Spirosoma panaciterrae]
MQRYLFLFPPKSVAFWRIVIVCFCWLGILSISLAQGRTWYVKADSSATNDGTSWAKAASVYKALALAQSGDQIWLTGGGYPTYPFSQIPKDADNTTEAQFQYLARHYFLIPSGVKVYGHFAGDEATLSQRHGGETQIYGMPYQNHTIVFKNASESTLLDGIRIKVLGAPAQADDGLDPSTTNNLPTNLVGHCILNFALNATSKPTVSNCTVEQTLADGAGQMISNIANGGSGLANLRILTCYLVNMGTLMSNSAVLNRSYGGGKADLVIYNSNWFRVNLITNFVKSDIAIDYDALAALIVNFGTGNTCRIINCKFDNVGIHPETNDPSPSGSYPRSVFYLMASLGGASSDIINCQVINAHNSQVGDGLGYPSGFTSNVNLSHCVMSGITNRNTFDVTTIEVSGSRIHRYGDLVYGCPTDPSRHLVNLADGTPTVAACNTMLTDQGDNSLLIRWPDLADIPGLADRINNGRIDIGVDETNPNVYLQTITGASSLTVSRNSPSVMLLGKYCGGTVNWNGPNGVSGAGTSIPVSTSLTGSFVYQATCTTNNCTSSPSSVTVTVAVLPDLSPTVSLPQANFSANGPESSRQFVVNVFEVGGKPTSPGSVTLTVSAPTGYSLSFNSSLTSIVVSGGTANPVSVENGKWTMVNNLVGQQLTLTLNSGQLIGANSQSVIGFTLRRTTANSGSVSNMTVNIADDSSGSYDSNPANNVYARIISGL